MQSGFMPVLLWNFDGSWVLPYKWLDKVVLKGYGFIVPLGKLDLKHQICILGNNFCFPLVVQKQPETMGKETRGPQTRRRFPMTVLHQTLEILPSFPKQRSEYPSSLQVPRESGRIYQGLSCIFLSFQSCGVWVEHKLIRHS